MKLHITEGGPKPCKATVRDCKYTTGENNQGHYTNMREAEEAYAKSLGEVAFTKPLKKTSNFDSLTLSEQNTIRKMVDRESEDWAGYYKATDAKHFSDKTGPGSKYTDPRLTKIEDVVALAIKQRGGLDGDDRAEFIKRGAKPGAFKEGNRYLMVKTPGVVGVVNTREMKDTDLVKVVRTKPGANCNLVATVDSKPETDYGVIVIASHQETGEPVLITTFPGTVTKNEKNDTIEALEGQTITVAEARKIYGEDIYVNTELKN